MKYKLIKEYPGSPKLGIIAEPNDYRKMFNNRWVYDIGKDSEFWQLVEEKDYQILSIKYKDQLFTYRP